MNRDKLEALADDLASDFERRHAWLLKAGPIARQANQDARKDRDDRL